jgi:hypothetical protein
MPTEKERFTLSAILLACCGIFLAIRFGLMSAWLAIANLALAGRPIVQSTPETHWSTWGLLGASLLMAASLLAYWLGPIIIARGIERSARQVQEFDGS